VVLSHLRGEIFLSLEERGDVALHFDELAGDGFRGTRAHGTAGDESGKRGSAKDGDIAETHGETS
jgi:hypothetical protein